MDNNDNLGLLRLLLKKKIKTFYISIKKCNKGKYLNLKQHYVTAGKTLEQCVVAEETSP